jgi:hypothetical protein
MKNSERFNRAIKALVAAFFNGTLAKGDCRACAVGNMVACSKGVKLDKKQFNDISYETELIFWRRVFFSNDERQVVRPDRYEGKAKELIDSTGYNWRELAKVEKAFEINTEIHSLKYPFFSKDEIMQDQYNGLMAVVSVLCEIEGIESQEEYKEMFAYKV